MALFLLVALCCFVCTPGGTGTPLELATFQCRTVGSHKGSPARVSAPELSILGQWCEGTPRLSPPPYVTLHNVELSLCFRKVLVLIS